MPSSGHQILSGLVMVTPAISTASALTAAPRALDRRFVGAQSEERGLAKLSIGGPLGVHELRDKLRAYPGRVFHARRRVEGRLLRAQRLELCREHGERLVGEAGPDLAHVAQLRPVEQPDEECAKVLTAAFRRCVPADHEFGLLAHLDLAPQRRTNPRLVQGALVLRDNSLPTETLGLAVRRFPVVDESSRDEERNGPAPQKPIERRAAVAERSRHEGSAVLLEQIEDRVARRRCAGDAAPLKELKPRDAHLVESDELAINHDVAVRQRGQRVDDVREPAGEVLERSRPDLHASVLATSHRADAVVLLLEDPVRSLHDARRERRQHRANRFQRGSPVAAFATSPPSSRAIPARSRRVSTERGFWAVISWSFDAYRSVRLNRSHWRPRVRIRVHLPLSLLPCRVKVTSPRS